MPLELIGIYLIWLVIAKIAACGSYLIIIYNLTYCKIDTVTLKCIISDIPSGTVNQDKCAKSGSAFTFWCDVYLKMLNFMLQFHTPHQLHVYPKKYAHDLQFMAFAVVCYQWILLISFKINQLVTQPGSI